MKHDNIIQIKSYEFALKITKLYFRIIKTHKEYHLSSQIARSGTSIGSNIEEAIGAQSNRDFIAKLSIAYKEARETHFRLRLYKDCGYLKEEEINILILDCEELLRIITSILNTSKRKSANNS